MTKRLLTLALGLLCFVGLRAQTETTIAASDIVNWAGSGTSQAILIVEFDTVSYAWGYRFDAADEPTVLNMITAIDAADPRLAYSMDWSTYDMKFYWVSWPEKLIDSNYRFKVNGVMANDEDEFSDYDVENGMVVKVSAATGDVWSVPVTAAAAATMPENSTIALDQVRYWVGTGAKRAVVAFNWGEPDTALAWGIRFDSLTIGTAMTAVAAADPRLSVSTSLDTIIYNDGESTFAFHYAPASFVQFILNDNSNVNSGTAVNDGDVVKIGESAFGTGYDSTEYGGMWYPMGVVWNAPIVPVAHPDAEIAASDILYWVGTGSNQVVLAVNWADTALAWGYRFSEDSVMVATVMDSIAAADPRFSYDTSGLYLTDIRFALSATDTLAITPFNYFESTRNHMMDAGLWQMLGNGDFEKWADPAAGTIVDSMSYEYGGQTYWYYTYVYLMPITPVSVPEVSGIRQAEAAMHVQLWPNPATQVLNVSFELPVAATEAALYDVSGRRVSTQAVAAGSTSLQIGVDQLPAGVYVLTIGNAAAKVAVRR